MSIEMQKVFFSYGDHKVLSDFSLKLPERGILAVTGESGSGKTTILRLLCRLIKPDSGKIILPPQLRTSFIFQEDRLLPWFSALDNLRLVTEDAELWLDKVGLSAWGDAKPSELSGGMCRRIAIARALAFPSGLMLMDEPLKGLDPQLKGSIMELIHEKCRDIPGVLVTHDHSEVEALASEEIILEK